MNCIIHQGDALNILSGLPAASAQCCITSPPYWRQRDYGHADQIGQERTPEEYVTRLAGVFDEVKRVLSDDGTLWLNIGDTYHRKQLVGVPWMLAFELKRRGWLWRAEIVWSKGGKPEPVRDRPTRAHEALLLFAKRASYFYDYKAILEPHGSWAMDCIRKAQASGLTRRKERMFDKTARRANGQTGVTRADFGALMNPEGKNKRDVWDIPAGKWNGDHSAVMPVALAEVCVKAGSRKGDSVIDPFCGSGSTGVAALALGRKFVGVDLLTEYARGARERCGDLVLTGSP